MRDLASRLRAIVRSQPQPAGPVYEADLGVTSAARDPEATAARLGGRLHHGLGGACVVVDRRWEGHDFHGRRQLSHYAIDQAMPIALFDPALAEMGTWADRVVFFDIETTGLSGGAGTLAFLAGCAWFEDGGFRVRQFFLNGPGGERAMLDLLGRTLSDASLIVTYNGRTFDVPLMETRWAFHRQPSPVTDVPHFDMLPPARRLWSLREDDRASCSLSALEPTVLGFHRRGDVPGFEIPVRYFHFLRSGDAGVVEGVLEHNRHDLVSLAAVMAHALRLASDGPEACGAACEQLGLGRLYARAGVAERARLAFTMAADAGDGDVKQRALEHLAVLCRREGRFDEAATAWQRILDDARRSGRRWTTVAHRAAEALAIHHEHRARDLETAKQYAEVLQARGGGAGAADVAHRLGRIERKLKASEKEKGGPTAASLLT